MQTFWQLRPLVSQFEQKTKSEDVTVCGKKENWQIKVTNEGQNERMRRRDEPSVCQLCYGDFLPFYFVTFCSNADEKKLSAAAQSHQHNH